MKPLEDPELIKIRMGWINQTLERRKGKEEKKDDKPNIG
jgi:hypothetical protein